MNRFSILSSSILSAGYGPESQVLEIEFQDGSIYQYFGVPQAIYDAFLTASSKGRFLNANVRDRFPNKRVG